MHNQCVRLSFVLYPTRRAGGVEGRGGLGYKFDYGSFSPHAHKDTSIYSKQVTHEWVITFCWPCEQRVEANWKALNCKSSAEGGGVNSQIYTHGDELSSSSAARFATSRIGERLCVCETCIWVHRAVLYRLEMSLFSSPANQEMKRCAGCCGKGTLPVYP